MNRSADPLHKLNGSANQLHKRYVKDSYMNLTARQVQLPTRSAVEVAASTASLESADP